MKVNAVKRYRAGAFAALAVTILLAGCVSTQERFEKGMKLEAKGRFAEATTYYVKVLQREPDWPDAPARLLEAGTAAVNAYLDDANAAEAAGNYEAAVRELDRLDALRRQAEGVGVTLPVPDDFAGYREEMTEEAMAALIRRAEQAEQAGRWSDALRAYERVQERYAVAPEQRAAMMAARGRVIVRWSEEEMARGHFRAAYDRAEQAVRLLGPDAPTSRLARGVQEQALDAGTRYVAFMPTGSTEAVARQAPRGLLRTLDDVLQFEHWSRTPLFLAPIDPGELHRELRRLRYDRDRLSERQAAEAGRALQADLVVLLDLAAFEWTEADLKTERRAARTRGSSPKDTAFVVERYRVDVRGEAAYLVLDPRTRTVLERGTVDADASDRFERGRYDGDDRDLDLSRRERGYFDRSALEEDERALENVLVDELADRLARQVFESLLRRVP